MQPIKTRRSTLRYPLDDLLGSPAHIRLMRVLVHEVEGPVGVTEAATMTGLTPAGARKALERLEQAGTVVRVGTGRAQKYGLRDGDPYTATLAQLFAQEQRHYEDLLGQLQLAVDMPEVTAAWIEQLPLVPTEPLELSVVVRTTAITWIGQELRLRLADTEKRFDLIIEIAVFTRADAPESGDGAVHVWGAETTASGEGGNGAQSHAESAARSLRMAEAVAVLIRTDPSLIRRAKQYVDRLLREGQGTADSDLGEWKQLLETYSPERLRNLLVSTSSRAQRLRRSSPFFAVLSAEERDRVVEEIEKSR